jgi:hypothetical protein
MSLAAELGTPVRIGRRLARAFEAGSEIDARPIGVDIAQAILSREPLRGELDRGRTRELTVEMRAAAPSARLFIGVHI